MLHEKLRGKSSEKPQVFYSDKMSIDIVNLKLRKKISFRMFPGCISTTTIENLKPEEENKLEEKNKFMEITRELVSAKLDSCAVNLLPGSEIEPIMRADELVKKFGDEVKNLRKMGVEKDEIEKMVNEQGTYFSLGKAVVNKTITDLNSRINSYFERADEADNKKRI
jgi:hypothetical protein